MAKGIKKTTIPASAEKPAQEKVEGQLDQEQQPVAQETTEQAGEVVTDAAKLEEGESDGNEESGDTQAGDAGQEKSETPVPETPAAETAPTPVPEELVVTGNPAPAVEPIRSTIYRLATANLDEYVASMGRHCFQTEATGAAAQRKFYQTLRTFLALEGQEFKAGMDHLLSVILANRDDVFDDSNAFRFMAELQLRENDRKLFTRLLNLFIAAAEPSTRKAVLERVNLAETIKLLPEERSKQLMVAYFQA